MAIETAVGALKGSPTVAATGRWSVANNLLKELYQFALRDLINNSTVLLEYIQTRSDFMTEGGEYSVIPLATGRENGHNHHAESGALPDPINAATERATYDHKEFTGRIKLSGRSMSATQSQRGSFLRNFEYKATALAQSMSRDFNRVLFGDGSGRLCLATGAMVGATLVVDNPGGFTNLGPGAQYLEPGMRIAIMVGTTSTIRGIRTIVSIDRDTNTLTLSSNLAAVADNDAIVRVSNTTTTAAADTAFFNEPFGLAALINDVNPANDGTVTTNLVGQLSRQTGGGLTEVPLWKSAVRDNGGVAVALEEDMLNQLMDDVDVASRNTIQMFLTTHGIRRALVGLQVAGKRFSSLVLESGYKSIAHSGIPVIPDRDCTKGRVYGLNFDNLYMFVEEDWGWIDKDGSVLQRMADQHSYQAAFYRFHQFGTDAPNTMGVLLDVQDDF